VRFAAAEDSLLYRPSRADTNLALALLTHATRAVDANFDLGPNRLAERARAVLALAPWHRQTSGGRPSPDDDSLRAGERKAISSLQGTAEFTLVAPNEESVRGIGTGDRRDRRASRGR